MIYLFLEAQNYNVDEYNNIQPDNFGCSKLFWYAEYSSL